MMQTIIIWEKQTDGAKLFVIDDGYVTPVIQNWLFAAKGSYAYAVDWKDNMGLYFMQAATTPLEDVSTLPEEWQPYCAWLLPFEHDKDVPLEDVIISNLYQITLT